MKTTSMQAENQLEVFLEKITQYQLEIKSLKAEIEQLRKGNATDQGIDEIRKILEEKHKQSQVKFRTIFEQSTMGNKILNSDLIIIEVNNSLLKMLGYSSKEDLLKRRILEFTHPDFVQSWQELQRQLWGDKIPSFSIDTCLVKKDKSPVWCRVTSILFQDEAEHLGFTILEDITERKNLEEKAKKLYDAQEMIMHLVAHDLKNPVHTISALARLLKGNIEKGELVQALEYIGMLQKTCKKSYGIIEDLIVIGEIESGTISKEPVDLVELIQKAAKEIDSLAKEKEIVILVQAELKAFVEANEEKLSRVLENLISNAIKFSNRGSSIKVILRQENNSCTIQVVDKGIGIPSNLHPIIFDRFTEAKRKGTAGEETTGLGLFISKRIVELYGGKIWLESTPNEGTSFFIRFPLAV